MSCRDDEKYVFGVGCFGKKKIRRNPALGIAFFVVGILVFLTLALWPAPTQRTRYVQEVEIEYVGDEMRDVRLPHKPRRRILENSSLL